jgi:C4-dicarboxylate-specific signal transduction histidine kinase
VVNDKNWLAALYRRAEMFPGFIPLRDTLRPLSAPGGGNRPRLLIADDEPDMLRFLETQLGEHYEIIAASDGDQAVTLASQYLPGVILCDMMLPEKDGLEVCRILRANAQTRDIPMMILTARADDETKLQCLAAGANDFLTKPFSTAEVRVRLKNLVDNNQLQKALAWQNKKLTATVEQLKETELQLVQSEKMAALGRMSAGIIHEINNPINFAKTGLYTLGRKSALLPETERADYDEILKDIEEGITRVAAIVGDMRAFTHPQGGGDDDIDVDKCLTAALRFLAAETKGNIQVIQDLPNGFTVRGNRNKLLQVFVNLLQNSIDALRHRPASDSPATIRVSAEESEGVRRIRFWDNGPGISEENLRKIFDPFFTTKDVGQGTGLGLSICYRILSDSGGRITVRSQLGEFSEFCLEFPES